MLTISPRMYIIFKVSSQWIFRNQDYACHHSYMLQRRLEFKLKTFLFLQILQLRSKLHVRAKVRIFTVNFIVTFSVVFTLCFLRIIEPACRTLRDKKDFNLSWKRSEFQFSIRQFYIAQNFNLSCNRYI